MTGYSPQFARRVNRKRRPDDTFEVWITDRPDQALTKLGRVESALVYAALWLMGRR